MIRGCTLQRYTGSNSLVIWAATAAPAAAVTTFRSLAAAVAATAAAVAAIAAATISFRSPAAVTATAAAVAATAAAIAAAAAPALGLHLRLPMADFHLLHGHPQLPAQLLHDKPLPRGNQGNHQPRAACAAGAPRAVGIVRGIGRGGGAQGGAQGGLRNWRGWPASEAGTGGRLMLITQFAHRATSKQPIPEPRPWALSAPCKCQPSHPLTGGQLQEEKAASTLGMPWPLVAAKKTINPNPSPQTPHPEPRTCGQLQVEDCVHLWDVETPGCHITHNERTEVTCRGGVGWE